MNNQTEKQEVKINDRVKFKYHIADSLKPIFSGVGIGTIKDIDGDYFIILTGLGEFYINRKEIIQVLEPQTADTIIKESSGLNSSDEEYKIKVDNQITNLTKGKYKRSVKK